MIENNKKNFMKILNIEENLKIKREENFKETRKINREESIMKKRKEKIILNQSKKENIFFDEKSINFEIMKQKEKLLSKDIKQKLESTIEIRKYLSVQKNPPIEEVVKSNLVPIFIEFLRNQDEPQLQFEAAWILTNIASGSSDQTMSVVHGGAVNLFIKFLESPNDNLKEQSVWALGNIAGDSPQNRDFVLDAGILDPLLNQLNSPNRISFLKNSVWTLSNLCRGKPGPKNSYLKEIFPTLQKFIFSEDSGILADVCWTFSYISDGSYERIQNIIELGVIQRIVEFLMHPEIIIQIPALRIIGNIATGNDLQTQVIINCGALPCLLTLLNSFEISLKKEACWTISNITAGNPDQIQAIIDAKIIPTLINIMKYSEMDIKKEAAWAISNATSGGSPKQINYLIKQDCINPMIELLSSSDSRVIRVILDGLENILEIGSHKLKKSFSNEYTRYIEQAGGLEKLENLQYHTNKEIYEHAVRLLEKFFGAEEENHDISENPVGFKNNFNENQQIPNCFFGFSEQ